MTTHRQIVSVIGDSNANIFKNPIIQDHFANHEFKIVAVRGATVSGLSNPNSKTQAYSKFMRAIRQTTAQTTIFLIGEVDTGYVIWYRSENNGIDISTAFEQAINNYTKLLGEASKSSRVICISAPLPTIKDGCDFGEVANLRQAVKATQRQRTELTLRFNGRMRDCCLERSFTHIDLDADSLGADGLVRPDLVRSKPGDHHYRPWKYAALIVSKLGPCLKPGTPTGDPTS